MNRIMKFFANFLVYLLLRGYFSHINVCSNDDLNAVASSINNRSFNS